MIAFPNRTGESLEADHGPTKLCVIDFWPSLLWRRAMIRKAARKTQASAKSSGRPFEVVNLGSGQ